MYFRSIGIILAILVLVADQYSKIKILEYFDNKVQFITKITNFLNLCLVWNKGVSFGLFNNYENSRLVLLIIAISIVLFLLYLLYNSKSYYHVISLSFIIGGAIGNICDRYQYGAVIDFIEIYYKRYSWPAFNVADSFIVLGLVLLMFEKKMVQNEI